jgi:glycosyltransferase involved in cell wall biosynthesis
MKLALIGPTYPFRGGIAHHTTLLCKALRQNHDVKFISFTRQYPGFLFPGRSDRDTSDEPVKIDGVDYIIDSLNPLTWLAAVRQLKEFQPEKLILPWWVAFWTPQFLTILSLLKYFCSCEIVFICHNAIGHDGGWLEKLGARIALSKGDLLITHSREETDKLRNLLGKDVAVVSVIHPTYSPLSDKRYAKGQAKDLLGLRGPVLLFFGFVRNYKGLNILLDAMPLVLRSKEVTLVVVGEFWKDKRAYLEQIQRYGIGTSVRIVDEYVRNEKIGVYFGAADLVVLPYLSATGSGVCQAAFGFDRPVVAGEVGGISEIVEDGINGKLVAPGNPQELATAILWSLEPKNLNKLSANSARTKERFSWEKLAAIVAEESPPPIGERQKCENERGIFVAPKQEPRKT